VESSRLVRVVFALLVLVTVGAFFITQALKTEMPVVLRFAAAPKYISPNGDGVRDRSRVGFDLSEPAEVSFSIIDDDGSEVRRLLDDRQLAGDRKYRYPWDGRDDDGNLVADGTYRMRVARRKEGRILNSFKKVIVDTRRPQVELVSAAPGVVDPSAGRPIAVRISYRGPRTRGPEFRVWRTDDGPPRIVDRFRGDENRSGVWNGRVISGDFAVDGDYALQVRVRDRAGNEALAPAGTPNPRSARPHTGVAVRRLTLAGPLTAITPGSLAHLRVGPGPRRFTFTLTRLGSRKTIKSDRRRGTSLRIRIPDAARTGVYVVEVRARGRRARWPLPIAGLPTKGALDAPRPLAVLPAITWQGLNRFDSDLDGFADTLRDASSIPAERPFAGGRLPARLAIEAAPLLRFLDRERIPYDLTTDLSLARGEGPALGNAPGIAIAGSAIWLTRGLRDRLRDEVEQGGKGLAAFGGQSLRRSVALTGGTLRFPSPRRPDDLFGERIRSELVEPPAPLSVERDRLSLFGSDPLFGEFSAIEVSERLPDGARLLSSAGRDIGEPAFVAYRLGKGTVIRPGTPQWASQLNESALAAEVPEITTRIWRLLGRD
jgi:hypothetical protein